MGNEGSCAVPEAATINMFVVLVQRDPGPIEVRLVAPFLRDEDFRTEVQDVGFVRVKDVGVGAADP